jgi:ATP-dependent Lon protease
MNQKLKDVFKGKVVNKALTINTAVGEFPRYVVEYLITPVARSRSVG